MPVVINGSTGISGVDGSAGTPAVQGSDTNTGVFFPAADTIAFSEGGTEAMRINSDSQIVHVAGTASLPSVTFTGDLNTGIYSPGADRIGFAEGGVQVGEFDASSNFLFNSGYGSVAIAYGCRAWVNFNGTGTVAIRASGNVTSITDNGTGDYTVNFTNAMPDVNFSIVGTIGASAATGWLTDTSAGNARSTSTVRINTLSSAPALQDTAFVNVAIFR